LLRDGVVWCPPEWFWRAVRVGVDLSGTGKITQEMLAAQLMYQFADLGRVVEVVAVVHHR
jgi:hypothetical protein